MKQANGRRTRPLARRLVEAPSFLTESQSHTVPAKRQAERPLDGRFGPSPKRPRKRYSRSEESDPNDIDATSEMQVEMLLDDGNEADSEDSDYEDSNGNKEGSIQPTENANTDVKVVKQAKWPYEEGLYEDKARAASEAAIQVSNWFQAHNQVTLMAHLWPISACT